MTDLQGLGTDIIEVERIKLAISRHGERFIQHLFTEEEQRYCNKFANPLPHFSGRFAAKEAVLKALGTGLTKGIQWKDIEIRSDSLGKPEVFLSRKLAGLFPSLSFFLSISHTEKFATATAIALRKTT